MKHFRLCLLWLLVLPGICLAGTVVLPQVWWEAMQKVSNFREVHSETNLPPTVVSACAGGYSNRRLIWAVTDGQYYVVHEEGVPTGGTHTNSLVLVATVPRAKGAQTESRQAGYSRSFKDYRTFINQTKGPFLGTGF